MNVAPVVQPSDDEMTRPEVARRLKISISHMRRLEVSGILVPTRYVGTRSFYSPSYIQEVAEKGTIRAQPIRGLQHTATTQIFAPQKPSQMKPIEQIPMSAKLPGDVCARVFSALKRGLHPTDVVIEEGVNPHVVKALWKEWGQMKRYTTITPDTPCIVIMGDELEELGKLGLDGEFPVETCGQLLENIRQTLRTLKPRPCAKCGKAPRRLCGSCALLPTPSPAVIDSGIEPKPEMGV